MQYTFAVAQLSLCIFELERAFQHGPQVRRVVRKSSPKPEDNEPNIWNENSATESAQSFRNWFTSAGADARMFYSYVCSLGVQAIDQRYCYTKAEICMIILRCSGLEPMVFSPSNCVSIYLYSMTLCSS